MTSQSPLQIPSQPSDPNSPGSKPSQPRVLSDARAALATAKTARIEAEKQKYLRSLGLFTTELLGFTRVEPNGVHQPLLSRLEERESFLLVLWPRGSFKSTIATVSYPLWRLCENGNLRILITSQTDRQGRKFLNGIKDQIEKNPRFVELFGNLKHIPGWAADSIEIAGRAATLRDPSIQATGVNKPVTGGHYDIIIADDLHDQKNSKNKDQCDKVIEYWRSLFPILNPGGQMVVIGTRWSPFDLYGHILDNETLTRI